MLDPSYLSCSPATYVTFVDRWKHAVDFSGGLKQTFDGHQQTHGAETNAQVALESCWEYKEGMGRGQADDENRGLRNVFKVNEPEMVESLQTEDNLLGVSVLWGSVAINLNCQLDEA